MRLPSLVVRALEQCSKDLSSSPGGDTGFSHQQKLLPVIEPLQVVPEGVPT